jgi:hypothetical protein
MPDPVSELIMQAVVTRIQTLTIPNLVVEEGENPDFGAERFVHVKQTIESNEGPDQFSTAHNRVLLGIEITVGGSIGIGEKLRTVINGLMAEVKRVLREDDTLGGLCFLRWIASTYGDPNPEEGLPRQNIAVMEWEADYVHPYADPYTHIPA